MAKSTEHEENAMNRAYLPRMMEPLIPELSMEYPAILLVGPRQTGKTRMLRHIMEGTARHYVSLDDLTNRALAKQDPAMFLQLHPAPVLIDEVQYAPELFSQIKKEADERREPGAFWLTGSQPFRLMKLAGESLAGRVAVLRMDPLSHREACGLPAAGQFTVSSTAFRQRVSNCPPMTTPEIFAEIWRGSLPGLVSGEFSNRDVFYSSYVQTYIERDVRDIFPGVDPIAFTHLLGAVAARAGQEVNIHEIAKDLGVGDTSVRTGLGVLEKSDVIHYLHPYSSNALKRTVKSPKLYFFDTGLVAYLTRWSSPETLEAGAMSGAIFENWAVNEIRRSYSQLGLNPPLWYYRDRDGREIDLVIERDGALQPVEIKKSASPKRDMTASFRMLDRAPLPRGTGAVVCMADSLGAVAADALVMPAWAL